jgi:pyrroloquinoline quinone (PQQ) biosynthesis protein C
VAPSLTNPRLESFPSWIRELDQAVLAPRRRAIEVHPFTLAMQKGTAEPRDAEPYFSGLMWHLLEFGKHVAHHMKRRDPAVAEFLVGRSEDVDGDTEILGRIVRAFGGPVDQIQNRPWTYRPHPVWIRHDALLRSAIYSEDLPWQVGTAALNVGIESLVPTMIEPLFKATVDHYGISRNEAEWLESRAGEAERQHGENGYYILNQFVSPDDSALKEKCSFFIEALSGSMAYGLLDSGLRPERI